MGIMNFISKQFVDVIQWTENEPGVLAYRFPMQDMEIQNGAQLVVRETQKAMFINEGKLADKFSSGTYKLTTQTLPILTYLKNWDKFFESPFKSDVYFFSAREQTNQAWGTTQPITIRDKEFGPIRLRAFGSYSYAVDDVEIFWTKLCGTAEKYAAVEIEGQLRAAIMTTMASFMSKTDVPFIDMAANQDVFSQRLKDVIAPAFQVYGLSLKSFFVQSLSLPENLQKYLDRVGGMRMVGDLQKYAKFQAADAITDAATNSGGGAGAGIGLGVGMAMSQAMMANSGISNPQPSAKSNPDDIVKILEGLGELLKKGIVTQAEFDSKKTELLSKLK